MARWIEEKAEFENVMKCAYTCVYIDSGRETTLLRRLTFDDANILTQPFRQLLTGLMERSAFDKVTYAVLRPDPVHYFRRFFHKFPVVEVKNDDPPEEYLRILNEDPGNSPADAIGINWLEAVIAPASNKWFVHALRDSGDRGGHLWIPEPWMKSISTEFPFLRDES